MVVTRTHLGEAPRRRRHQRAVIVDRAPAHRARVGPDGTVEIAARADLCEAAGGRTHLVIVVVAPARDGFVSPDRAAVVTASVHLREGADRRGRLRAEAGSPACDRTV